MNLRDKKFKKIFLGGTCNKSKWREKLIPFLDSDYFNPVVKDWNKEAQKEEERQKNICDCHLYIITPKMTGVFSIAELIDDSNKYPEKTVFLFCSKDENVEFTYGQLKSLHAVGNIAGNINNAVGFFNGFVLLIEYLNNRKVNIDEETLIYKTFKDYVSY